MEDETLVRAVSKIPRQQKREFVRNVAKQGSITHRVVDDITNAVKDKVMSVSINLYSVAVAWVLKNKLGYGEKKLLQVMKQIRQVFDSVNVGELSLDDMKEELHEFCGLKFIEEEYDNDKEENI